MVLMVSYEAFVCRCGAGDVVLRESYQPKTRGKLYYACPKSKPRQNYYGCQFFLWKEERVGLLISSPGGSSTPSFSPGTSLTPISSPTPSTPPIHYGGSPSNTECSNCKHLLGRIKVLQATLEMYMHPEQYTLNSASLLHDLNNDMKKLGLE
ncbi:reverse transcriptase domain-containing protein [Tanacetum coccineum]